MGTAAKGIRVRDDKHSPAQHRQANSTPLNDPNPRLTWTESGLIRVNPGIKIKKSVPSPRIASTYLRFLRLLLLNSCLSMVNSPVKNKITKRTHFKIFDLPANKGVYRFRPAKPRKNEPIFPAKIELTSAHI